MTARNTIFASPAYEIDVADISVDHDSIRTVWSEGGDDAPDQDKFDNFYLGNPAGQPLVFLLWSTKESKYVGVLCAAPRDFFSYSTRLRGVVLADLFVKATHRTLGPSIIMLREAKTYLLNEFDFVYGFMNPIAAAVGKRVGLTFRQPANNLIFPLSTSHYLQKRFPNHIGYLLGKILHAPYCAVALCLSRFYSSQYKIIECQTVKLSCAEISSKRNGIIMGERSAEFTRWRFKQNADSPCLTYFVADKKGNACGYIAYTITDDKHIAVLDILAVDKPALKGLLSQFISNMIKKRCLSISVLAFPDTMEAVLLRKVGFKKSSSLPFFCDWRNSQKEQFQSSSIYMTRADNDV